MNIYLVILVLFIIVVFIMDSIQMLIRINSARYNSPVLGAHLGSVLLLINRGATAIVLMLIGFLVDIGVGSSKLVVAYGVACIGISLCHLLLLNNGLINFISKKSFVILYNKNFEINTCKKIQRKKYKLSQTIWLSLIMVTIISYFGLLIPSVFATAYYEYRATLMQSGFLINAFSTFVYVIYVEKKMALVISNGDHEELSIMYKSYVNSRTISYGISFMMSLVLIYKI